MKFKCFATCVSFLLCIVNSYSQQVTKDSRVSLTNLEQNEVKISITNSFLFPAIDISYERILNENRVLGISIFRNLRPKEDYMPSPMENYDFNKTTAITVYHRSFFSKTYARGWFLETFSTLNSGYEIEETFTTKTDLGLGLSIGAKGLIEERVFIEFYLGAGYNLLMSREQAELYRGGISMGYRF